MQIASERISPKLMRWELQSRWSTFARRAASAVALFRYQGPGWLLFRASYALKQRVGWFRRRFPCVAWMTNPSADAGRQVRQLARQMPPRPQATVAAVSQAERLLEGRLRWFSRHEMAGTYPPSWSSSPWDKEAKAQDRRHWSLIGDFSGGDIKCLWEQARFGFVFPLVRAFAQSGESRFVEGYWAAIEDWRKENPPQQGPHWKCGQEVALRVMAWSFGLLHFIDHPATTPRRRRMLTEMLEVSGERISANIDYALSQRNNHAVSEAAALFTLGILLERPQWTVRGEQLLNRLASQLIYPDGSFSQHSVNYHRLMLHDYLWAIWLGRLAGRSFAPQTIERVAAAGRWLLAMLSPLTGRVPNLGANDGAHFLDLTDGDYLDYRPIVQAVGAVLEGKRWLPSGEWDELAGWMGVPHVCTAAPSERITNEGSPRWKTFPDGGYATWRNRDCIAVLRCPTRFRHRPGQCDLLHFDLTVGEHNLLRDAGTFSYNSEDSWQGYFASSAAHNTIRVDGRDPMPKISRFLYGYWPRGSLQCGAGTVTGSYRDAYGVRHQRTVVATADGFRVEDELDGTWQAAVLRWRLDPDLHWTVTEHGCVSAALHLDVRTAAGEPLPAALCEGMESLYYLERTPLPVLEVMLRPGQSRVVTEMRILSTDRSGLG